MLLPHLVALSANFAVVFTVASATNDEGASVPAVQVSLTSKEGNVKKGERCGVQRGGNGCVSGGIMHGGEEEDGGMVLESGSQGA